MNNQITTLTTNSRGLFDLLITDSGRVVVDIKNITIPRAVVEIENFFYTSRSERKE
jgi:hypothetical protein